jgi:hypothetical protein
MNETSFKKFFIQKQHDFHFVSDNFAFLLIENPLNFPKFTLKIDEQCRCFDGELPLYVTLVLNLF